MRWNRLHIYIEWNARASARKCSRSLVHRRERVEKRIMDVLQPETDRHRVRARAKRKQSARNSFPDKSSELPCVKHTTTSVKHNTMWMVCFLEYSRQQIHCQKPPRWRAREQSPERAISFCVQREEKYCTEIENVTLNHWMRRLNWLRYQHKYQCRLAPLHESNDTKRSHRKIHDMEASMSKRALKAFLDKFQTV